MVIPSRKYVFRLELSTSRVDKISAISAFSFASFVTWTGEIDNSETLVEVQEKTARLKASTLNSTRILFLQTPFYSTFFWNGQWMKQGPAFWHIAFPITLLLAAGSIWLYRNIDIRNADKKWFRLLSVGRNGLRSSVR
jgi:hypothetical protein